MGQGRSSCHRTLSAAMLSPGSKQEVAHRLYSSIFVAAVVAAAEVEQEQQWQ